MNDDSATGAQAVVWTSMVGVTANGNSLTDMTGANTGAVSTQQIASGDGYVEFTSEDYHEHLFGIKAHDDALGAV